VASQRIQTSELFIDIVVDGMITVNCTLSMPPEDSEEEKLSVLPFIRSGRPYRSRTCDTLVKRYRRIVPPSKELVTQSPFASKI